MGFLGFFFFFVVAFIFAFVILILLILLIRHNHPIQIRNLDIIISPPNFLHVFDTPPPAPPPLDNPQKAPTNKNKKTKHTHKRHQNPDQSGDFRYCSGGAEDLVVGEFPADGEVAETEESDVGVFGGVALFFILGRGGRLGKGMVIGKGIDRKSTRIFIYSLLGERDGGKGRDGSLLVSS